ncbi:hypothetical protein M0R45_028476 [Rubus argutus]|uniref:MHC class I antigen n=1 Tax=Rubus argutus TaxID=59490 RepID=A0AAW1W611_RUBAR
MLRTLSNKFFFCLHFLDQPVRGKHGGAAGGAWAPARAEQGTAWLGAAEVMQEVDTQQRRCRDWARHGLGEPAVQRRHNGDGDPGVVEWVAGLKLWQRR